METPAHAITCLKSDGLHQVWLIQPPGHGQLTLKTWPLSPWMFIKLLLGIAQPQRQVRGAQRLARAGVPTPKIIEPWRFASFQSRPIVQLKLEFAPGRSAFDLVGQSSSSHSSAAMDRSHLINAARQVGEIVTKLAAAKIFHRDLKLSNIVIDDGRPDQPQMWIIDTVGVRPMRNRIAEIERMLERLAIQPMRLDAGAARGVRFAVLLAALRPLHRDDRRDVLRRLRLRAKSA